MQYYRTFSHNYFCLLLSPTLLLITPSFQMKGRVPVWNWKKKFSPSNEQFNWWNRISDRNILFAVSAKLNLCQTFSVIFKELVKERTFFKNGHLIMRWPRDQDWFKMGMLSPQAYTPAPFYILDYLQGIKFTSCRNFRDCSDLIWWKSKSNYHCILYWFYDMVHVLYTSCKLLQL